MTDVALTQLSLKRNFHWKEQPNLVGQNSMGFVFFQRENGVSMRFLLSCNGLNRQQNFRLVQFESHGRQQM